MWVLFWCLRWFVWLFDLGCWFGCLVLLLGGFDSFDLGWNLFWYKVGLSYLVLLGFILDAYGFGLVILVFVLFSWLLAIVLDFGYFLGFDTLVLWCFVMFGVFGLLCGGFLWNLVLFWSLI